MFNQKQTFAELLGAFKKRKQKPKPTPTEVHRAVRTSEKKNPCCIDKWPEGPQLAGVPRTASTTPPTVCCTYPFRRPAHTLALAAGTRELNNTPIGQRFDDGLVGKKLNSHTTSPPEGPTTVALPVLAQEPEPSERDQDWRPRSP